MDAKDIAIPMVAIVFVAGIGLGAFLVVATLITVRQCAEAVRRWLNWRYEVADDEVDETMEVKV